MIIEAHKVKHPLRGYPMYPRDGLMPTRFMIRFQDNPIWRRVYERWDLNLPSGSSSYDGQPVALVKVAGEKIDLTPKQCAQIGWERGQSNR